MREIPWIMCGHMKVASHGTISSSQTVLRLIQSSSLSASCSRLLLQITSSLLLGENVSLPNSLIQETVQKVCACKDVFFASGVTVCVTTAL